MSETPSITLREWLECLRATAAALVGRTLRFDGTPVPPPPKGDSGSRPGAYIALVGERESMHVGLSSTSQGCRALARGLLGVRFDVEMSDKDVKDACAEVINILAGLAKARMGTDGSLRLGLPMFVTGEIQVTGDMEADSLAARLGPVDCQLHVYRRKRAA